QVRGRQADTRSDIFSVGAVAYELLSYRQAFDGENKAQIERSVTEGIPEPLSQVGIDVTDEVCAIVERALEKEQSKRFQSVNDMLEEIQRVRETLKPLSDLTNPTEPTVSKQSGPRGVTPPVNLTPTPGNNFSNPTPVAPTPPPIVMKPRPSAPTPPPDP